MRTTGTMRKAWERIISALAEFDYLTPAQITRLLYAPASLTHVYEQMRSLVDRGYVLTLGGRAVNLPLIYTLSGNGRQYAFFAWRTTHNTLSSVRRGGQRPQP